ncbi:hypothetical protein BN59_02177 [Legionella massiliensis]|uniref:Uncharacterized protein n=1 Tax=Legionella massiliensis TaxID=1034943 RepID=A0A078L1I7_9GAMM|nr:hypothetical protein [Legionella massiliensis]CDZ77884.1 hypothetical protein BN59_02177 [Legionella massiliensis]CEE13622.1 hypothetical protein BN1094_02177 [Legionella massiliensis]
MKVNIPSGVNKYHCSVFPPIITNVAGKPGYDKSRDNAEGLKNVLNEHVKAAMKNLNGNPPHSLPVTLVYNFGMNSSGPGHVGAIAVRIASFGDPSKNEIMVINSLPNYPDWEQAAINGVQDVLRASIPNRPGKAKKHVITPRTYPNAGIQQELRGAGGMDSSCGGIIAEMCSAISPNTSFEDGTRT